ncbi:MAG: efflux RND transporter periplasmic adaptor subunit [Pyrinomonadaceae bacterium]
MEEKTPVKSEFETIDAVHGMQARRRKMMMAAIGAGVASIAFIMLLVWYLTRPGDAGRPVPAPTMSTSDTPDSSGDKFVGQTITLSATEVENAGLAIETVGEQLSAESETVAATGVVEANAYKQTPAVSLVGGIVRGGLPELGDSVRAGQTIAVVFSDEFAQTQSRYIALRTEAENARRNYERSLRLVEINQPGRGDVEQAARQRKAAEAAVTEFRNRYERTTKLIGIGAASREELEQDTTKLRTAEAELEEARLRETRAQRLLPISPEVRAASEEALNKLRTAETELAATRERLILYGMPSAKADSLRSASQVSAELFVPAPVSGTVTSRAVNAGEVVDAGKELLRITDLSTVWVIAQVFERDVTRLRVGSGASVTSDAFPDGIFRGQITYIDPQLDNATRTGKVRIELANPSQALKLGMYVNAAFGALGDAERTSPVIPAGAVQRIDDHDVVFVPTDDQGVFALRSVRLGPKVDGRRVVQEGLAVGDRVVTKGSFLLRAAWSKAR